MQDKKTRLVECVSVTRDSAKNLESRMRYTTITLTVIMDGAPLTLELTDYFRMRGSSSFSSRVPRIIEQMPKQVTIEFHRGKTWRVTQQDLEKWYNSTNGSSAKNANYVNGLCAQQT
jgi:hypothetical protein